MKAKGSGPLPSSDPSEWPHRPAYICAHPDVQTKDYEQGAPLPLDETIDFETDVFVGKALFRLKPIPPNTEDEAAVQAQEEYFKTKSTLFQFVIQGRFRKEIPWSDLVMGDYYERPLQVGGGLFIRLWEKFMESLYPGMVVDMTSETPTILSPLAAAQTMRVDLPGEEPNLADKAILNDLHEDTTLLFENPSQTPTKLPRHGTNTSAPRRRGHLSKPKNAVNYSTNPAHVYTIEVCDNSHCPGSYYQYAVGFKIDMTKTMNAQALSFAIFSKKDREVVCKFPVWHERLIDEMNKAINQSESSSEEGSPVDRVEDVSESLFTDPSTAVSPPETS